MLLMAGIFSCKQPSKKQNIVGMDAGVDTTAYVSPEKMRAATSAQTETMLETKKHDTSASVSSGLMLKKNNAIADEPALKRFVNSLKNAVAANRKIEISSKIKYPLNPSVKNVKDFYREYEHIFTPAVKDAIMKTNIDQLFHSAKGVMIANGRIWIVQEGNGFKIMSINYK